MRWFAGVVIVCLGCGGDDSPPRSQFSTADGEPNNVALSGANAYVTLGAAGLDIVDVSTAGEAPVVAHLDPMGGAHDVAVDGDSLFVLGAVTPGSLSMFDISDPTTPTFVDGVVVEVGPFTGISAANGTAVVSGGAQMLSVHPYEATGFTGDVRMTDLGRGQPDVLVDPEGQTAFVSNHFSGEMDGADFGIASLRVRGDLSVGNRVPLPGAGFTPGTATPANFGIESALSGNDLVVAHGAGVALIDVSNREQMSLRSVLFIGFAVMNVDAAGGQAFAVGNDPPVLAIVDIAGGRLVEARDLPGVPTGVAGDEQRIVVAAGPSGVINEAR